MRRKCSFSNTKDDNESNRNNTAVHSSSKQQQQDGRQHRRSDARPPKPTAKSIAAKSRSTAANEDDKLKRPRSAYIIFLQEYAANLQPSGNTQFGSKAGEAWRLLSAEEKQKYQTMCDRERLDYKLTKDENANKQRRNAADNNGDNCTTTTPKNNNYNDGSEGGAVTSSTVLENFEQNPTLPPPRIPKSSYLHFFEDWKEKWRRENPEESKNAKMSILSQLAGEEWRSMNAIQKQPWVDKVIQEKQIYTTWKLVKSSSFKSLLNLQESSSKEEEKGEGGGKEEGDREKKNNGDDSSIDAAAAAAGADQQQQQQQRKKKRQRPSKKTTNSRNTVSSLKKDDTTNNDSHHDSILITTTNNNNNSGDFSLPPLPPNKKRSGNLSQLLSGSGHLPPPALRLPTYQRVHVDAYPLPFPPPLQVHQHHQQSAPLFMNAAGSGSGSGSGSGGEMNRVLSYNSATDAAAITTTTTTSTSQQLDMVSNPTIKDRSDSTPHFVPANAVNPTHPPSSSTAAVSYHRMVATSTSAVLDPSPFSIVAPGIQNAYKGDAAVVVTAMTAHNALPSFPPPPPPHQGIVSVGGIDVIPSTVAAPMMIQTINNPHLEQQHVPPLNVQEQQAQHLQQQKLLHNPLLSLPPPSLQQQQQQQKQQQQQQAAAFDLIDDKLMHAEAMVSIIENKIKKQ